MPKVWGGRRLGEAWNKPISEPIAIGESWEVSDVPGHVSRVCNGPLSGIDLQTLMNERGEEILGKTLFKKYQHQFPLLIKLINAAEVLSVQVHPNDAQALKSHGCMGKTEMWYILESSPGAFIINGFTRSLSKEEMSTLVREGRTKEVLRTVHPDPGDVFYIPGGRVHAIGKDIVLAEIQETSDITYRIFDWDRHQPDRPLQIDQALDVLDYSVPPAHRTAAATVLNESVSLLQSPHFSTNQIALNQTVQRSLPESGIDSFVIYICIEGAVNISVSSESESEKLNPVETLKKGDTLLIPACINRITLSPLASAKVLEVYVGG